MYIFERRPLHGPLLSRDRSSPAYLQKLLRGRDEDREGLRNSGPLERTNGKMYDQLASL
jgi:hypothetical protein